MPNQEVKDLSILLHRSQNCVINSQGHLLTGREVNDYLHGSIHNSMEYSFFPFYYFFFFLPPQVYVIECGVAQNSCGFAQY